MHAPKRELVHSSSLSSVHELVWVFLRLGATSFDLPSSSSLYRPFIRSSLAGAAAGGGVGGERFALREPTGLAQPLFFLGDALTGEELVPETERLPPQPLFETVDHPSVPPVLCCGI